MSERKTTEIKLRLSPAEKTAWQLAAEDEGIGLSELIRREMNTLSSRRTLPVSDTEIQTCPYSFASDIEGEDSSIEPTSAVSTSHDESRVAKPWMFEARSGE